MKKRKSSSFIKRPFSGDYGGSGREKPIEYWKFSIPKLKAEEHSCYLVVKG
jgi:hypothetical protein